MSDQPETAIPVLLVEDNEIDAEIAKRVLAKSGVQVSLCIARDGKEALDLLFQEFYQEESPWQGRQRPRLIVLDLGLPGFDGREVLRRLRADERTRRLPVVILTRSSEENDIASSYDLGANSYVRKPVIFEKFAQAIRQLGLYWLLINEPPPKAKKG